MKQHRYLNAAGEFDYQQYRKVQTAGNHRKISAQWVDEKTVNWLSDVVRQRVPNPRFGICHGTRQGKEQAWFSQFLNCDVIGTEISDTATRFPNTIEWDFHEMKPEWLNSADFIYSNSWDHSYDPHKLFPVWMSCIAPGGICIVEHSPQHLEATELDPLGMTVKEMVAFLDSISDDTWKREELLEGAPPVMVNGRVAQKVRYHILRKLGPTLVLAA